MLCGALSYVVGNFESVCELFERIRFLLSRAFPIPARFSFCPLSLGALVVCVFIFSLVMLYTQRCLFPASRAI